MALQLIHELENESEGDLLDLRFWIGNFSDEGVSCAINPQLSFGIKQASPRLRTTILASQSNLHVPALR